MHLSTALNDAYIKPHAICRVATRLFQDKGYDEVSMADVADSAGITEAELFTYFGNKQDIILFLYQGVNADWQLLVGDIAENKLSERLERAIAAKIDLVAPYTSLLSNMMGVLVSDPKVGVSSPRTSHIRAMGMHVMQQIVDGASDSKLLKKKVTQLPSLLYFVHWAVLFVYIQTGDKEKALKSAHLVAGLLKKASDMSLLLTLSPFFKDIGGLSEVLLPVAPQADHSLDREILKIVFNNRKTSEAAKECLANACDTCISLHESKINYFTRQGKPVHFILPAFPAKSPNHTKVLGSVPDLGEEIALVALNDICRQIKSIYSPGASITICSDGRIFSELVGVSDADVTTYVAGINRIIETFGLEHISIINLEDLMQGGSFDELRQNVLAGYAEPLDDLRSRVKSNADAASLFNGIHRFITDDRRVMFPGTSISKVKKESGEIALRVIQHSNAWTRFLAWVYPDAVRLSIHPYPAHSDKIGIRLTKAVDNWITPWHGVIVLDKNEYILMKRSEADEKGCKLVYRQGQPVYYELTN